MSYNIPVLDLDTTGYNPDNRVENEPHALGNRQIRAIAPRKGVFFADSVIVRDGTTVLVRGVDYQIVELHQELTLRYGKEISAIILIINPDVPSDVEIDYQAVGGHYAFTDGVIANLYQSVMNDNRTVAWQHVTGKPDGYTPTIHRHLVEDVFGFEYVVDYLERIKRAITLGQTSVVLEIVNGLLSRFTCEELPKVIPNSKLIRYDALLYFLSKRKLLSQVTIDTTCCTWIKGQSTVILIDTTSVPVGTTLHWSLYKQDAAAIPIFSQKHGSIVSDGTIQRVSLYVPSDLRINETELYVGVKYDPADEEFLAVTYIVGLQDPVVTNSAYGYMLSNSASRYSHKTEVAHYDSADELRAYYMARTY